jgi:predicted enzyme related to lactoylglutathione lyase
MKLGWFMRRVPDRGPTVAFYRDVLGLPVLPVPRRAEMFWAGETMVFCIGDGGAEPPVFTDRTQSTCIPVFRCINLESVMERVTKAGRPVINDRQLDHGRLIYVLDPSGNVTGFQERYRNSTRQQDADAFRRIDNGENTLAGVGPMPPDIYGLGWIVSWFENEESQIAWYRDVAGFSESGNPTHSGGAMLSLGTSVLFDAKGGGQRVPPVTNRLEASNLFIMRVDNFDEVVAGLKQRGAEFFHEPFDNGGKLAYIVDPEGQLIGFQQRHDDSPRPEDIAERAG